MYCQIIFAQDPETLEEAENLLYEEGGWVTEESIKATIEYLSGWDYGSENEYDDALADEIEENRGDDVYYDEESGYTIVARRGLYVSLWRECDDPI